MYALTEKERTTYYANVVAVVAADAKLDPREQEMLVAIQKDLKLKKNQIALAEKTGFDGSWIPQPVGTWANQVDNLETMVRVALVDDDLSDAETRVVATFATAIGLNQTQMDNMVEDVKRRRWMDPDKKTEEPTTLLDFSMPNTGVAIEFAESTSGTFPEILKAAEAAPVRQQCVKNRKTWYLAAWPNGTLADAIPLALLLAPLQNKGVWIAGEECPWRTVLGFARCAADRARAYRPENYCFGLEGEHRNPNPWGCIEIGMEWTEWADWFKFGQWQQVNGRLLWRFDKPRIQHQLHEAFRTIAYCPHLVKGLPQAFLSVLPDAVDPFHDPDWTYRTADKLTPGAVEITLQKDEDGFSYEDNLCVLGVAPKSQELYNTLLDKAFAKLDQQPRANGER